MTVQTQNQFSFDKINQLINSIPRLPKNRGISWASSPAIVAQIVQGILSAPELPRDTFIGRNASSVNKRLKELSGLTGINYSTFKFFLNGKKCGDNGEWPELREELTKLGISWLGKPEIKLETQVEKTEYLIRRAGEIIPHIPLVMESSGNVVPITPIPPPSAMVANPGDFTQKNKTVSTTTVIDDKGNIVITSTTTRIVPMGTQEYISILKISFEKKNSVDKKSA